MPHIHEKIDFTAQAYVVYKDKVLLRKHEKYGIWVGVGGHIELHEEPNEAVIREVKEEVELTVKLVEPKQFINKKHTNYKELVPPLFMNIHRINDTHKHISLEYVARSTSDRVLPENATDEWMWLTRKELDQKRSLIGERMYHYASIALRIAGKS